MSRVENYLIFTSSPPKKLNQKNWWQQRPPTAPCCLKKYKNMLTGHSRFAYTPSSNIGILSYSWTIRSKPRCLALSCHHGRPLFTSLCAVVSIQSSNRTFNSLLSPTQYVWHKQGPEKDSRERLVTRGGRHPRVNLQHTLQLTAQSRGCVHSCIVSKSLILTHSLISSCPHSIIPLILIQHWIRCQAIVLSIRIQLKTL